MSEEKKELWGRVSWNDATLTGPWVMQPGLLGERNAVFDPGADSTRQKNDWSLAQGHARRWQRTTFDRPQGNGPFTVDLQGMRKGLAWLNGHCIGRYWLTPGVGLPDDPHNPAVNREHVGEPTQRYYHLPAEWLADHNVLILFEELGGNPGEPLSLFGWAQIDHPS